MPSKILLKHSYERVIRMSMRLEILLIIHKWKGSFVRPLLHAAITSFVEDGRNQCGRGEAEEGIRAVIRGVTSE